MKFNAAVLLGTALSLAPSVMVAAEPISVPIFVSLADPTETHGGEPHHSVEARADIGGPGPRIEATLTETIDGSQVAIPTEEPRFEGGHGPRVPLSDNINSYSAA